MFIKSVRLKNFKCFSDKQIKFCVPDGVNAGSGLNIFVGENNSGKSSLMEAIYFLRNKSKKNIRRLTSKEGDECFVEQAFIGDIESAIDNFAPDAKKESFKACLTEEAGDKVLTVKRSFEDTEAQKNIFVLKDGTFQKNPGGIDASFQTFFQISNIWADTSPEEEGKFGSSTVCGNLLADISEKFKVDHKQQYDKFEKIFHETFNDNAAGLQADLNSVASETQEILNEQFGPASLRFKFDTPELSVFFKNIKIFVDDGDETELAGKGHGMQRAVILSLLQVYARRLTEIKDEEGYLKLKPHFLFIDEPEMGLHPQAQRKLFEALKIISKDHQVFISTHSEHFISPGLIENTFRFEKQGDTVEVYPGKDIQLDLSENRKFFLHHHKLFFAKRALFLEGPDDLERYGLFCEQNGFPALLKDMYLMGGCQNFSIFRSLCEGFNIPSHFMLDLDVLSKTNTVHNHLERDIKADIIKLNKETSKKNPENLLDANLTESERLLKTDLISRLRGEKIYVPSEGAVEHYLDGKGGVLNNDVAKKSELVDIFVLVD